MFLKVLILYPSKPIHWISLNSYNPLFFRFLDFSIVFGARKTYQFYKQIVYLDPRRLFYNQLSNQFSFSDADKNLQKSSK